MPPVVVSSTSSSVALPLGQVTPLTVKVAAIAVVLVSSVPPANTSNFSGTVDPFLTVFQVPPRSTGL